MIKIATPNLSACFLCLSLLLTTSCGTGKSEYREIELASKKIDTTDKTLVYGIQAISRVYDIYCKSQLQEVDGYTEVMRFVLPGDFVYRTDGSMHKRKNSPQFKDVGDVYAIAMKSNTQEGKYIIAIRGTADFYDIKLDLETKLVDTKNLNGKVISGSKTSRGYEHLASALGSSVGDFLSNTEISDLQIFGHSLGGAIAQILAIKIVNTSQFANKFGIKVRTIGSPRMGNQVAVDQLQKVTDVVLFENTKYDHIVSFPKLSKGGYAENFGFVYRLCFTDPTYRLFIAGDHNIFPYEQAVNDQLDIGSSVAIKESPTFESCLQDIG